MYRDIQVNRLNGFNLLEAVESVGLLMVGGLRRLNAQKLL